MMQFLMVMAMILWGGTWAWGKVVSQMVPAEVAVFCRFFFAAIGFLVIVGCRRLSLRVSVTDLVLMCSCSMLMGLYQFLFFSGLRLGLAGAGGVLTTTLNPLFTFIIASILARKLVAKREWFGLGLGLFSAVFFLQLWALDLGMVFRFGNAYFLAAALCWSLVTIVSQRVTASPFVYSVYAFGFLTPILFFSIPNLGIIWTMGWSFWWYLLLLVGLGSLFATSVYFRGAQVLGAKGAASFFFIVPVSAVVFSFFTLGEVPTWPTVVGGILALSGVYVLRMSPKVSVVSPIR